MKIDTECPKCKHFNAMLPDDEKQGILSCRDCGHECKVEEAKLDPYGVLGPNPSIFDSVCKICHLRTVGSLGHGPPCYGHDASL